MNEVNFILVAEWNNEGHIFERTFEKYEDAEKAIKDVFDRLQFPEFYETPYIDDVYPILKSYHYIDDFIDPKGTIYSVTDGYYNCHIVKLNM